jgi:hypothetical protein
MNALQLIDIEINIPEDVQWTTDPPEECKIFHTLDGQSVHSVRTTLENRALERGYDLRRTEHASYLQRGEQRIEVHQIHPTRIGIRVDDAYSLPTSQVSSGGIILAGISLPLPDGAEIEPGRERHDPGSTSWCAEWRIRNSRAAEVASLIHDALIQRKLRSGGLWSPPEHGIRRWKVEAYSPQQLVQAVITDEGDYLSLSLTLIGESGAVHPPRRE